ncbi:hypothetical protein [Siminovitchia sp. 179-K 8D1 HS]
MTKIHVLADETLGGVEREYVEANCKTEVGDNRDFKRIAGGDSE